MYILTLDPSGTVLYVLELLKAPAMSPDEESVAVIESWGDEGMDQLFSIWQGECGTEFGNVPEVVEGGFAQVFDVGVKGQMSVKSYTQVGNWCGEG